MDSREDGAFFMSLILATLLPLPLIWHNGSPFLLSCLSLLSCDKKFDLYSGRIQRWPIILSKRQCDKKRQHFSGNALDRSCSHDPKKEDISRANASGKSCSHDSKNFMNGFESSLSLPVNEKRRFVSRDWPYFNSPAAQCTQYDRRSEQASQVTFYRKTP
jgi:hypothetical protein